MLDDLLARLRDRERQLVVYGEQETDLEQQFATLDVSVVHRPLPPEVSEPFVVIEEDGTFAGAVALSSLEELLEPPIVRPGERDDVSPGYQVLFDALEETVFTAMNRRQLLAVTREIEERAFRLGSGTLRASFQTPSAFESQLDVYRTLGTETDLDIHIYGRDDWELPAIPNVAYHALGTDTIARFWLVALESDDGSVACGLIAEQQQDHYRGFWTDDPAALSEVLTELGIE
jgi:hypothetical protein